MTDTRSTPAGSATEEMAAAARGVMQLLRGKHGATMTDLYEHCRNRGDDVRKWPQWALDYNGYVTEEAAAMLVYELMDAHRCARSESAPIRWQTLDTLPAEGRVLAYSSHGKGFVDAGQVSTIRYLWDDAKMRGEICGWTHWAPLPEGPK